MRISDWSSDVCSSDLLVDGEGSDAGSAGRRVRCIGVAMVEIDPRLGRGLGDGLVDILAYRHGPHRNRTVGKRLCHGDYVRSEEHTSELQSLMRVSYAVFCLKKKKQTNNRYYITKYDEATQLQNTIREITNR